MKGGAMGARSIYTNTIDDGPFGHAVVGTDIRHMACDNRPPPVKRTSRIRIVYVNLLEWGLGPNFLAASHLPIFLSPTQNNIPSCPPTEPDATSFAVAQNRGNPWTSGRRSQSPLPDTSRTTTSPEALNSSRFTFSTLSASGLLELNRLPSVGFASCSDGVRYDSSFSPKTRSRTILAGTSSMTKTGILPATTLLP